MSGAGLISAPRTRGERPLFPGLRGVGGVDEWLRRAHRAHGKRFCSGSWDWRCGGPGQQTASVQASSPALVALSNPGSCSLTRPTQGLFPPLEPS